MDNNNTELKATPMDELLKLMVVENFKLAIQYSIQGNDEACFKAYKSLFHLIEPYDFNLKTKLTELTDLISEFIKSLNGKPINSQDLVNYRQRSIEFRDLLQIYMSEIPKAYAELGLWFKVFPLGNDFEKQAGFENFNSEMTMLDDKKKVLIDLDIKKLVSMMRPNHIHECYARWRIENAA